MYVNSYIYIHPANQRVGTVLHTHAHARAHVHVRAHAPHTRVYSNTHTHTFRVCFGRIMADG